MFKPRSVILRTYGGLGNQIFQVLYGRIYSDFFKLSLFEIHSRHYKHKFNRVDKLLQSNLPSKKKQFISRLRIPKILNLSANKEISKFQLFNDIYLDGYFQDKFCFETFPKDIIYKNLMKISEELSISNESRELDLLHLRLGDFFLDKKKAIDFAKSKLRNSGTGTHIITNVNSIFKEKEIIQLIEKSNLKVINTEGKQPDEIMKLMSSYKSIDTNDSTIAFWAAILSGSKLYTPSRELMEIYCFFKDIVPNI